LQRGQFLVDYDTVSQDGRVGVNVILFGAFALGMGFQPLILFTNDEVSKIDLEI
jgi:hypothetical protein